MSDKEEQIVGDETFEESNVDAQAEDDLVAQGSDSKQLQNEADDLNTDNIIDDTPGVQTRGVKVDATKQDREIDAAVDDAEQADASA